MNLGVEGGGEAEKTGKQLETWQLNEEEKEENKGQIHSKKEREDIVSWDSNICRG